MTPKPQHIIPLTESHAETMITWQYPPPYDVYNFTPQSREDEAEVIIYLLNPLYNFHAILGENEEMLAFCSFGMDAQVPGGDYSAEALDIGMGVRPNLIGQGAGHLFRDAVLKFAREKFAPPAFRVTVASFNQRAQRLWLNTGFVQIEEFEATHTQRPFRIYLKPIH